jgi:hypothetical protein
VIDPRARRRVRWLAVLSTFALVPVGVPHAVGAAIGFILGDYLIWRD